MNLALTIIGGPPQDESKTPGPRFKRHNAIESSLKKICEAWYQYLQHYVIQSEHVLGNHRAELPWKLDQQNERATVSTLSAAISRKFPESIAIEELNTAKGIRNGRCDLWASIPDLTLGEGSFNFYLEAKRARRDTTRTCARLEKLLAGQYGIGKLFSDLAKSKAERITHSSPYAKTRKHEHFYIGLLITVIDQKKKDIEEIPEMVRGVLAGRMTIRFKKENRLQTQSVPRTLSRLPSVSLLVLPDATDQPGMIATFVVLGATKKLKA